jgi:hypothetical protein
MFVATKPKTQEFQMVRESIPIPLTKRQLLDEFFIENRTRLIDLAAFLDRLDRAKDSETDFRVEAMRKALAVLMTDGEKMNRVQMIFSDPTTEPLEKLTEKSARGAFDPRNSGVDG